MLLRLRTAYCRSLLAGDAELQLREIRPGLRLEEGVLMVPVPPNRVPLSILPGVSTMLVCRISLDSITCAGFLATSGSRNVRNN